MVGAISMAPRARSGAVALTQVSSTGLLGRASTRSAQNTWAVSLWYTVTYLPRSPALLAMSGALTLAPRTVHPILKQYNIQIEVLHGG